MAWLTLAAACTFCVTVSISQETCTIPVLCDNPDGTTTTKTIMLPTNKDVRKWRKEAVAAKRERDRAQMTPNGSSNSHCSEAGWMTGQGGECQYKVLDATLSWENARKYCMQNGSDLAYKCITKGDNFRYLTDRIKGQNRQGYWIGLSDRANEGEWKWLDGNSATNAKWANNQPDNNEGDQNCGWISPGMGYNIDDGKCIAQFFPLCERLI